MTRPSTTSHICFRTGFPNYLTARRHFLRPRWEKESKKFKSTPTYQTNHPHTLNNFQKHGTRGSRCHRRAPHFEHRCDPRRRRHQVCQDRHAYCASVMPGSGHGGAVRQIIGACYLRRTMLSCQFSEGPKRCIRSGWMMVRRESEISPAAVRLGGLADPANKAEDRGDAPGKPHGQPQTAGPSRCDFPVRTPGALLESGLCS